MQDDAVDGLGALHDLYDAHVPSALGYAHALLSDRQDAEQVVKDALLQVWRAGLGNEPNPAARQRLLLSLIRRCAAELLSERRRSAPVAGVADPLILPEVPQAAEASR